MIELLSDNPLLKYVLLVSLFAVVSIAAYFTSLAVAARQVARQRLDQGRTTTDEGLVMGSLRSDRVESAWLKMVDRIEKAGLSLVDTKDANVRRKLIAAGYTAPYAPRVYTLVRLVLVIALPTLLLSYFWATGSMPGITGLYFSIVIAAVLGLYLPVLFVRAKADRRQEEIINGLPRRSRFAAGLRRGRSRTRSGLRARRHGDDGIAPAHRRAIRHGRAGDAGRPQSRGCPPADGRSGRRR
jgi:tight adherence protein C